jgi:peptidoglycan hydrolase-like protein with peptidoglycan-binding domain
MSRLTGSGHKVWAAIVIGIAAAGLVAWELWPRTPAPAASGAAVPVRTARIVRADVAARQIVPGTLGYRGSYSVVNELPGGITTWVPSPGSVVRRGQVLYRVADQPAVLMIGPVPAWRSFQIGMAPGPDVRELEANLVALGFDPGQAITVNGQFTWATAAAIERWQLRLGLAQTGTIPLGQIVFVPFTARVALVTATRGTPVAPGSPVLQVTSTRPTVSVALPVGQATVRPGDHVIVTLPDGTTTITGIIAAVGRVATGASPGSPGPATIAVTVRLARNGALAGLDQAPVQVTITEQEHPGVLAVPVTALLARPGGGYAVQLASPPRRLIAVTTGLFDDATGLVEVSGPGLTAGLPVEVAAG